MRIVTWNCCRGSAQAKLAALRKLAPSIAVVQECARLDDAPPSRFWVGDNPRQGVAAIASDDYGLEPMADRMAPKWVIPFRVSGPQSFLLFAVWAKQDPLHPYVQGVIRAVEIYRDLFESGPAVLVGDLNSNSIWNRKRAGARDHGALVSLLGELGLVSAYHEFHGEAQGDESRPTFYFRWQRRPKYHIDYCFIPRVWVPFLRSVTVGRYSGWSKVSDHRPVAVELAFSGAA